MKAFYILRLRTYDASNPSAKVKASNITVTLSFNNVDLVVVSNSDGYAIFEAFGTMNYNAGDSVNVVAIDYQQILQTSVFILSLPPSTVTLSSNIDMKKEFTVKVVLSKKYLGTKIGGL
jgi:hypothetical protein